MASSMAAVEPEVEEGVDQQRGVAVDDRGRRWTTPTTVPLDVGPRAVADLVQHGPMVHDSPTAALPVAVLYGILRLRAEVFVVEQAGRLPRPRRPGPRARATRQLWISEDGADGGRIVATAQVCSTTARPGASVASPPRRRTGGRGLGAELVEHYLATLAGTVASTTARPTSSTGTGVRLRRRWTRSTRTPTASPHVPMPRKPRDETTRPDDLTPAASPSAHLLASHPAPTGRQLADAPGWCAPALAPAVGSRRRPGHAARHRRRSGRRRRRRLPRQPDRHRVGRPHDPRPAAPTSSGPGSSRRCWPARRSGASSSASPGPERPGGAARRAAATATSA